jgi:hypothetical protein
MTRPARPRRAARPGRREVLAGILAAGILAACAALTPAASPPHPPARAASFSTPVLLAAHPSSPAASPGPSPAPAAAGSSSCGFLDVSCEIGNALTSWFAALARDALNPLLTLVGRALLSSPQAGAIPAVHSMWTTSLAIADSGYVLLVVIGALIVMGHETLQTSYSVKDIAPRLVTGFLSSNLSLVLIAQATTAANALSAALSGSGVTPSTAAAAVLGALTAPLSGGGVFLALLALAGAVIALVLVVVYVLRLMALVLLTAAAPLALAAHALPQTAWAARWWWRALTACLAIQVAQALVLTAAVRVFSSAGWLPLNGGGGSLLPVLTAICLLYIMMRIPWWISRPVLSPFGHSPVRRAARFAFYAAVLSRVSPLLRGAAAGRRPASGTGGRGRGPAGPRGGGPGGGGPGGGGPGGGGPRGPAAPSGGRPGTGPGAGTGPGRGQPAGSGPGRGHPGGTGPGRSQPGGSGPGPRRSPGRPAAASPGPGGSPRPRPPASGRAAARPGPGPQQRARLSSQARPVPRQPGQVLPPLPGMPPRPPRPGQRVLPSEVTRVPRSRTPGPRPAPAPPPRQFPLSPAPPARRPRAAGSRPSPLPAARHRPPLVPRVPEGDHR